MRAPLQLFLCVYARLAPRLLPSFYLWGGAQNEVFQFFFYGFVFLEIRVGYKIFFLESFPEVVHVWEAWEAGFTLFLRSVEAVCTLLILNSFNVGSTPSSSLPFLLPSLPQGTSVVSPIITPIILISIMVLYATNSPARLLHTNCVVFFTAFYFPMSKMVVYMMVSESSLCLRIWSQ